MHEHRTGASMTDESVDRAIGQLLDVEPSADFVARVRTRVEDEPMRSPWFGGYWLVTAVATACLLVIAATWPHAPEPTPAPASPVVETAAPKVISRVEAQPRESVTRATPRVESFPPVVVSPAEAAGLRYLMSAVRDGSLGPDVLPAASDDLEPTMPLVIEPMTIEPLVSAADLEPGVLQ